MLFLAHKVLCNSLLVSLINKPLIIWLLEYKLIRKSKYPIYVALLVNSYYFVSRNTKLVISLEVVELLFIVL